MTDEIVNEVRRARQTIVDRCDGDLEKLGRHIYELEQASVRAGLKVTPAPDPALSQKPAA